MVGHGDYKEFFRGIGNAVKSAIPKGAFSSVLGAAGGAAGSALGYPGLGAGLGRAAGSLIARTAGFGDYKVSSNSLFNSGNPSVFKGSSTSIRVRHREMFATLNGSLQFNALRTWINPGNHTLFPWLSSLSQNYEQWEPHGIIFEYEPLSGSIASGSPALGQVLMATQYDVQDQPFQDVTDMTAYMFSTSNVPCNSGIHAVECANAQTPTHILKTRSGPVPAGATEQLYDLGLFTVATTGQSAEYNVGQVWVSYDITLHKPKLTLCAGAEWAKYTNNLDLQGGATPSLPNNYHDMFACTSSNLSPVYTAISGDSSILPPAICGAYTVNGFTLGSANRVTFMKRGYFAVTISCKGLDLVTGMSLSFFNITPMLDPETAMTPLVISTPSQCVAHVLVRVNRASVSGLESYIGVTWPTSTTPYSISTTICCLPWPLGEEAGFRLKYLDTAGAYPLLS